MQWLDRVFMAGAMVGIALLVRVSYAKLKNVL